MHDSLAKDDTVGLIGSTADLTPVGKMTPEDLAEREKVSLAPRS
jgi:hypothetical protein